MLLPEYHCQAGFNSKMLRAIQHINLIRKQRVFKNRNIMYMYLIVIHRSNHVTLPDNFNLEIFHLSKCFPLSQPSVFPVQCCNNGTSYQAYLDCEISKAVISPSLEGSGVSKMAGIYSINPSQNLIRAVRIVMELPDMSLCRGLNETSANGY